jgi:SAM-dependent methyltransferase
VGVDFSPVAIDQATRRAALFGATATARFIVGDLTSTSLPDAHADAAVSIDAFHFAADLAAAAAEARRILRPGGRLVLTNWQPKVTDDARLPPRLRIDWPRLLRGAGFGESAWRHSPSGTTCIPASTGSPLTSVIRTMTPGSPACKTRPDGAFPRRASCAGSS